MALFLFEVINKIDISLGEKRIPKDNYIKEKSNTGIGCKLETKTLKRILLRNKYNVLSSLLYCVCGLFI